MEVVAALSSLLAIAGAAANVAKQASAFYHDLRDAPSDLASLRSNLRLTQAVMEQVCVLRTGGFIPQWFQHSLESGLVDIEAAITEIQRDYKKYADKEPGKRMYLKWAISSSQLIQKNENKIQSTLVYFNTMLHLAGLYVIHATIFFTVTA